MTMIVEILDNKLVMLNMTRFQIITNVISFEKKFCYNTIELYQNCYIDGQSR